MSNPHTKRIVVVAPNWLGDAVMSLPLLGYLGAAPEINLCLLAGEYVARVYDGVAGVDEMIVFARGGRTSRIRARTGALKALGVHGAVVLPPSFSSAVAPFLARVKVRVGFRSDGRGWLLTDAVQPDRTRSTHLSREYLGLGERALAGLGTPAPPRYDVPGVRVPTGTDGMARLFKGRRVPSRYAVLVPGAAYGPAKSWPCERYRELARELSREIPVVLAGGAGERQACETIAGGSGNIYNTCGETTMDQFILLLSRAAVVVANDSGAPHLAASIGVPVVVLFGSTSPRWTAPLGKSVDVVRAPRSCSPCFLRTCPTDLECFKGIETDVVLERTRAALASTGSGD